LKYNASKLRKAIEVLTLAYHDARRIEQDSSPDYQRRLLTLRQAMMESFSILELPPEVEPAAANLSASSLALLMGNDLRYVDYSVLYAAFTRLLSWCERELQKHPPPKATKARASSRPRTNKAALAKLRELGVAGPHLAMAVSIGISAFEAEYRSATSANDTSVLLRFASHFSKLATGLQSQATDASDKLLTEIGHLRKTIADLEKECSELRARLAASGFSTKFKDGLAAKLGEEAAIVGASWLKPLGAGTIAAVLTAIGLTQVAFGENEAAATDRCFTTYADHAIISHI
jgi:hypothetical protein